MAVRKVEYRDINHTLQGLREQVIDSLEYCCNELPRFSNPTDLFNFCKSITVYENDPPEIELIQTVQTLLENNFHGVSGAGDCDCFTVLTLALCIASGMNDNYIVLVGRSKVAPVHIYSAVKFKGKLYTLDLTNPYINVERPYKYRQFIPV